MIISLTNTFKALSDNNRLEILEIIKDSSCCACDLLEKLNISQSNLSHHMKVLEEADLINVNKFGKWTYYEIKYESFEQLCSYLQKIIK